MNETSNEISRFKALQVSKRNSLGTTSPRARGTEKERLVLDWIYRWGWASSKTLDMVTLSTRSSIASRLVKNGLLRSTKTESGGGDKGIPVFLLTLTERGLELAEKNAGSLIKYELDPYKIDQSKLRHDEISQRFCANALKDGTASTCNSPGEMAAQSQKNVKQADAYLITKNKQKFALEIELSAKWDRKLDQFVLSSLSSMNKSEANPEPVDSIIIATDSKAIIKRYKQAFKPGATLPIWTKNDRGFWSIQKQIEINNDHEGKILWVELNI